jgi:hypothetical protein
MTQTPTPRQATAPAASRAAAAPTAPPTPSLPVLKQLGCPNCGSPLPQYNPSSQTLICAKCNSYVTIGMEGATVNGQGAQIPPPPFPIRLGQKATLGDTTYFVLGRVLYEGWDDEDRWHWTEWLLGAADGRIAWLSFDKEDGFVLFSKMRIREAFNPDTDRAIPIGDGKKAYVKERYPAKIRAAEGELTWKAAAGQNLQMIEGIAPGKHYSIQRTSQELEMYEGKALGASDVASAFGDSTWVKQIQASSSRKGVYSLLGVMCLFFGALGLGFGFVASRTGDRTVSVNVSVDKAKPPIVVPVTFDQPGRPAVVKIWLQSNLPANTFADIDVDIISPDGSETFLFDHDFWHETGRDEDGVWTEKDTFGTDTFVPTQKGEHKMEFTLGETQGVNTATLKVEILKNHVMPGWLLGYGALIGVIGIGLMLSGSSGSLKPLVPVFLVAIALLVVLVILPALGVDIWGMLGSVLESIGD